MFNPTQYKILPSRMSEYIVVHGTGHITYIYSVKYNRSWTIYIQFSHIHEVDNTPHNECIGPKCEVRALLILS